MADSIIVLGSGPSSGIPQMQCLLGTYAFKDCRVCAKAAQGPPEQNKDYRTNPSIVIQIHQGPSEQDQPPKNILIDCGKTFREQCLRWFLKHNIGGLDALLLTHDHADAILGIDDIRGVQKVDKKTLSSEPLPCFLSQRDFESIKRVFPYLVPSCQVDTGVKRWVASMDWRVVEAFQPLEIQGAQITPVTVKHGEDYDCFGFEITSPQNAPESSRVIYLSDASRIPDDSALFLSDGPPIHLLILDCLCRDFKHPTHFNFEQALDVVRQFRPVKTYLVGMSHSFDFDETTQELEQLEADEGLWVRPAYDGMRIDGLHLS